MRPAPRRGGSADARSAAARTSASRPPEGAPPAPPTDKREPTAVRRRSTGARRAANTTCDGRGGPFTVIATAANVNDVTQTLALVDGIPPVAGKPGRARRRPETPLGDKGYDSNPNGREQSRRRILPVISRKGTPNIKGLGKLRHVVEQTFAQLHQFKRVAVHWERRLDLHNAFVSPACELIYWRRLNKRVA